uniref:Uncharacterized protein n=1 Tax=Arundo donax TaxID=35708 RepID=A0A0A8ZDT0_ARUDO
MCRPHDSICMFVVSGLTNLRMGLVSYYPKSLQIHFSMLTSPSVSLIHTSWCGSSEESDINQRYHV